MTGYYLPGHVHFGCRGDAIVFLDIKNDDYTLINGPAAAAVRSLCTSPEPDTSKNSDQDSLRALVDAGLLTTDDRLGRRIAPTRREPPLDELLDPDYADEPRIRWHHIIAFVAASTTASLRLRLCKLESILASVRRKRSKRSIMNLQQARELTAVFVRLRAYFPRNYLCLYDSLALIQFLAHYGVYPDWIFGIRLEPWEAHCWVQSGTVVFNEDPEESARYTAVMTV